MNRALLRIRARIAALAAIAAVLALVASPAIHARDYAADRNEITAAKLPREARDVLALIRAGGPFPYERDGVTFGNRERLLPPQHRGFYHEYTVKTPGATNRGARRVICGGPRQAPEVCYYTDDHYASFRRIRE
jgi:ribonuclease T1